MHVPSWCFCARAKFLSKNSSVYSCAGEQTHWGRWRLLLMGSCPQGFVTLFDCEWFLISARDPPASPRPTRTRETRKTRNASAESSGCACKQRLFCFRTRLLVKGKKMTQPFAWHVLASLTPRKYFARSIIFAKSETISFYEI